jgi:hypothetical protein
MGLISAASLLTPMLTGSHSNWIVFRAASTAKNVHMSFTQGLYSKLRHWRDWIDESIRHQLNRKNLLNPLHVADIIRRLCPILPLHTITACIPFRESWLSSSIGYSTFPRRFCQSSSRGRTARTESVKSNKSILGRCKKRNVSFVPRVSIQGGWESRLYLFR